MSARPPGPEIGLIMTATEDGTTQAYYIARLVDRRCAVASRLHEINMTVTTAKFPSDTVTP
jgi:hypothetical protein